MRVITLILLAVVLSAGVATADRHRDRDRRDHRDHRDRYDRGRGPVVRDHRTVRVKKHRRAIQRRPVYVNNGRYVFHGGITRHYVRPVIRHRYYDVRVRPQLIVEAYDPVPGYVWVSGSWRWNGGEWIWISGHWAVDPSVTIYEDDY